MALGRRGRWARTTRPVQAVRHSIDHRRHGCPHVTENTQGTAPCSTLLAHESLPKVTRPKRQLAQLRLVAIRVLTEACTDCYRPL